MTLESHHLWNIPEADNVVKLCSRITESQSFTPLGAICPSHYVWTTYYVNVSNLRRNPRILIDTLYIDTDTPYCDILFYILQIIV